MILTLPISLKETIILYVGAIEPRKNILNLIKAFELLKERKRFQDFKLFIVGFWGWFFKDIKKAYFRSPFKKDIVFTGFLKEEEILELMQSVGFKKEKIEYQRHFLRPKMIAGVFVKN
jgi:glycosyltransferase involved in cell wall biosynthesis